MTRSPDSPPKQRKEKGFLDKKGGNGKTIAAGKRYYMILFLFQSSQVALRQVDYNTPLQKQQLWFLEILLYKNILFYIILFLKKYLTESKKSATIELQQMIAQIYLERSVALCPYAWRYGGIMPALPIRCLNPSE